MLFCSGISLYSDISNPQLASLASFLAAPYPIQPWSIAYMTSLYPLHSWDIHDLAHTVSSIRNVRCLALYFTSLPLLLASSQPTHKTQLTCHLPQGPPLISPGWVRDFYFLFSIFVQTFYESVSTTMLTAPEVRDCVFSLLDSQGQAHNRNFLYRERRQFSCAGRWDLARTRSIISTTSVHIHPQPRHSLQRPHYLPRNQPDSCFVQRLALCWHIMFFTHFNYYPGSVCFLKLSVFEYMRFFCST